MSRRALTGAAFVILLSRCLPDLQVDPSLDEAVGGGGGEDEAPVDCSEQVDAEPNDSPDDLWNSLGMGGIGGCPSGRSVQGTIGDPRADVDYFFLADAPVATVGAVRIGADWLDDFPELVCIYGECDRLVGFSVTCPTGWTTDSAEGMTGCCYEGRQFEYGGLSDAVVLDCAGELVPFLTVQRDSDSTDVCEDYDISVTVECAGPGG
jgi:hypothetical protein